MKALRKQPEISETLTKNNQSISPKGHEQGAKWDYSSVSSIDNQHPVSSYTYHQKSKNTVLPQLKRQD